MGWSGLLLYLPPNNMLSVAGSTISQYPAMGSVKHEELKSQYKL